MTLQIILLLRILCVTIHIPVIHNHYSILIEPLFSILTSSELSVAESTRDDKAVLCRERT